MGSRRPWRRGVVRDLRPRDRVRFAWTARAYVVLAVRTLRRRADVRLATGPGARFGSFAMELRLLEPCAIARGGRR